jgi:xylan 1,4-beta-xylosidase
VLNVFRMFSKMGGDRVTTESSAEVPLEVIVKAGVRERPDVAAFASVEATKISVMVWHYHDDDVAGPEAAVTLQVAGFPVDVHGALVTHYRIDEMHSNSYGEWKRLGSPIAPTQEQYARLLKASQLAQLGDVSAVEVKTGGATVAFALPRQGVSLLVFDWGVVTK